MSTTATPAIAATMPRDAVWQPAPRPGTWLFVGTALLLASGAFLMLYGSNDPRQGAEGNRATQILWTGIYAVTLALAVPHARRLVFVFARNRLLLALHVLTLASALWSAAPEVTVRRVIALAGTTLLGVYFASAFRPADQVRLLAAAMGTAALASLAAGLAFPEIGISTGLHEGAWQGVFSHKNTLGRSMVLAALVFALAGMHATRFRWLYGIGFAAALGLIALSTSKTALVLVVALFALAAIYAALRFDLRLWSASVLLLLAAAGIVAAIFAVNAAAIFDYLGRDLTLTGRTVLWASALGTLRDRPLFGYGYGGYWLGRRSPARVVWVAAGWEAGNSHNGFVDLLLDLGIVGVLVLVTHLVLCMAAALRLVFETRSVLSLWPALTSTMLVLYNQTESAIIKQNHIFWILYVAAAANLALYAAPRAWTRRAEGG